MMYGAETSIPRKAMVGQLEPDGGPATPGTPPAPCACFQATDVVLGGILYPSKCSSFL